MSAPTSSPSLRAFSSSILFMRSPTMKHKRRRPFRTGAVAHGSGLQGRADLRVSQVMSGNCRTKRVGQGQVAGTTYFTVFGSGQDESPAANSSSIAGRAAEQTGGVRRGGSDPGRKPRRRGKPAGRGGGSNEKSPGRRD